jgi:hypothetical protein
LATACVPIPKQTTTIVFEAQGANAFSGSGGDCSGVAYSNFRFDLDDTSRPVTVWRSNDEGVRVSVLPEDRALKVHYLVSSTRNRKAIEFDASRIQVRLDGKLRQPKSTSVDRYTEFLWISSLTLQIDVGAGLPDTVTLETGPKAILANNRDVPLPRMSFRRKTRTTTMLTQPINC